MPETFWVGNSGTPCNKENERKQCKFPSLGSRKSLERNRQQQSGKPQQIVYMRVLQFFKLNHTRLFRTLT